MTIPMLHEANYSAQMQTIVEPYLAARRASGQFQREKGKRLYYETYRPEEPRGWIVICHGFCESIPRYNEVIYYFLKAGYAVAMMEHQGHGRSYRKVKEQWLTHVESFDDYVLDYTFYLEHVVFPGTGTLPVYFFAHSMGGAVASRVLERTPELPFQKLVLSSPMIAPTTKGMPNWMVLLITRTAIALGKGNRCVLNQREYTGEDDFGSDWCCSNCHSRYEWVRWLVAKRPELQNCSASYSWLQEAVLLTDKLLAEADKITLPTLLCQAGKDTMVKLPAQDAFLERLPNARKAVFPGAKHETFRCTDEEVEQFMTTVLDFFGEV